MQLVDQDKDICLGWAWLNKSCVRAERCYRLLSCPGSAAAAVATAVEQLGGALAAEQLVQPAAEGAAQAQAAHFSSSNKHRSSHQRGQPAAAATYNNSSGLRDTV